MDSRKLSFSQLKDLVRGPNREAFKVVDEISEQKDAKWVLSYLLDIGMVGENLWDEYRGRFNGNPIDLYCHYRAVGMQAYHKSKYDGRQY